MWPALEQSGRLGSIRQDGHNIAALGRDRAQQDHACPKPCPAPRCAASGPDRNPTALTSRFQASPYSATRATPWCRGAAIILLASLLGACGNTTYSGVEDTIDTPQGRFEPDVNDPNRQTIFGAGGISNLWDEERPNEGGGSGLGVNAFLWRASLDTFAFLPPISADPLGGVIIYDWYASPETPNERFKVTVYILGTRLRADGVQVQVNRQLRGADGAWYEAAVDPATAASLVDAVLTRARQMRIAQLGQ